MLDKDFTLYHYWRSSCSWRVRWGFAYKKQQLHYQAVNLLKNEQRSPDYLKKNPSGLVPSFYLNNSYVGESLAILEWLEEQYPNPPLLPRHAFEKLKVRQLCYTIMSGIQPLQNLSAQQKHHKNKKEQHHYARFWIEKGFLTYEQLLEKPAHGYSFGSTLTLADLCFPRFTTLIVLI